MSHIDEGELTAYADGAYAPDSADAQRIREHLGTCANCRNRLSEAQTLSARASELLDIAVPASLPAPDFEAVRARAGARRRPRWMMPLSWAATVVLALGLGWLSRGLMAPPAAKQAVAPVAGVQPQASAPTEATPITPAPTERAVTNAPASVPTAAPPLAPPSVTAADFAGVGQAAAAEYITLAEAERRGIELHMIPELEVLRVGVRPDTVVIEQKLPDARLITLTQTTPRVALDAVELRAQKALAPTPPSTAERQHAENLRRARAPVPESTALAEITTLGVAAGRAALPEVNVMVGNKWIRVSAPLPYDSLRAIANRIR